MNNNLELLQFENIKDDILKVCEGVLKDFLHGWAYNSEEAQEKVNRIPEDIIKSLSSNFRRIRFVCNITMFQKKSTHLNFSSTCLWHRKNDGTISVKWEDESIYCFVCLFCVN